MRHLPNRPRRPADESGDVAEIVDACLRDAAGALSDNTVRALRADLAVFAIWCRERDLTPVPAAAGTVAAFIGDMAEVRAPATVRRYVTSIAAVHKTLGCGWSGRSAAVKVALRRMHRRKGRRQTQARGLTWALRQRLLEVPGERLIDVRNRALLAVAYDAMLRRSELTGIELPDFIEEVPGYGTLLVRRAKTDAEGRGATVYLARDTVALVRAWLERSGIEDGRLFRSITKGGEIREALHPSQVPRIYKVMARRAGLPEEVAATLSGHSPRVGAAQDMVASGIEMPAILQAGRWKTSVMVNRYAERLLARRSGAAQLARLQRRE